MKKVAVISKPHNTRVGEVLPGLLEWLRARGITIIGDHETSQYVGPVPATDRHQLEQSRPDLVIVLGGDGTLLSAARAFSHFDVPLLGVNAGSLGFLTEVTLSEMFATLEAIANGGCEIDRRSMIRCRVMREGKAEADHNALNDVVVNTGRIARMGDFDVYVDGKFVSNYKADALIVATPTGSTAYSLAAGGPILSPDVDAFVVTPVSPHALTNRPLVLKDTCVVEIVIKQTPEQEFLTIDGQIGMPVNGGDRITCSKSEHEVKLYRTRERTFYEVLRTKLKWGER